MVRTVILGAAGRMGQLLTKCAVTNPEIKLVGAIETTGHPDLGRDSGTVAGIEATGVKITSDIDAVLKAGSDVIIDFTFHSAAPANIKKAEQYRNAFVLGTTGLTEDEKAVILEAGDNIPVVMAPNMSLGMNLLFSVVKKAASVLGMQYDISVDETHHIHKKDAPSGTALMLGEKVCEGLDKKPEEMIVHDPEGQMSEAPEGRIWMRSYRKGEVVGDHTVVFENSYERVEFTHRAWSRASFANGALRAAIWVVTQRPRVYDMQDVLSL